MDELVPWLGLGNEGAFRAVVDFNKRLVAAKGKELLIVSFCPLPIIKDSEPANVWGYFFGVLSGSRMTARTKREGTIVSLPLSRHFTWGRKQASTRSTDLIGRKKNDLMLGPLELFWNIEPSTQALCDFIAGSGHPSSQQPWGGPVENRPRLFVFIGDQITPGNIYKTVGFMPYPNELETVRRGLNSATETDKSLASAI